MFNFLHKANIMLGPLFLTLLLGFTTLILLLWYSYRKQRYWKERGIPQVKSLPILGSVIDMLSKPLHNMEIDRYKEYGKIYGHYEGNNPLLSIGEPEIIKQVLVKEFHAFSGRRDFSVGEEMLEKMLSVVRGEDWKRIRTIVSPTFTTGKIKRMISIFKECSDTLVQNFREAAVNGKPIEVKSVYGAFTMDIIASSCFSTKIDSHNDPNNQFVENAKQFFAQNVNWKFMVFLACPSLVKLLGLKVFPEKAIKFYTDVILQIIEERKKSNQTRNDFLQLLLDTSKELSDELDLNEKDDIAENYGKEDDQIFKRTIYTKKNLSLEELIAQCLIFFVAGFETTASTLAFASYNLALNPDIQEKLIQEIDDAVRETNGSLTYEAIQSMKYLDNVISETLRLYPPVSRLERLAEEEFLIKEIGIKIPKGMIVSIPASAIHIDPNLYPDPEKFDPDRFTPEERAKRDPYTYLPFGHGPRNCVGMRFALMEIKVCLANVLINFRIKRCPETKVPLELVVGQGLLQAKDVTLSFEVRTDAPKLTE